jgi:hypothetical protein
MNLHVECACGEYIPVTEGMAGTTVSCACGREVPVPTLAGLRRQAGLPDYHASPELFIPQMLLRGELPGPGCVRCGNADAEAVEAVAQCERAWVRGEGWRATPGALVLGLLTGIMVWRKEPAQEHGRDLDVPVPFKVCHGCRSGLSPLPAGFRLVKYALAAAAVLLLPGWPLWAPLPLAAAALAWGAEGLAARRRQRIVRNLVQFVPVYGRLLEKYPHAHISWTLGQPEGAEAGRG